MSVRGFAEPLSFKFLRCVAGVRLWTGGAQMIEGTRRNASRDGAFRTINERFRDY